MSDIVRKCSSKREVSKCSNCRKKCCCVYMLEIQRYIHNKGFEHVGYINALFRSREIAAYYYAVHNSFVDGPSAANGWTGDYDIKTKLRASVRVNNNEIMTLDAYRAKDMPIADIYPTADKNFDPRRL